MLKLNHYAFTYGYQRAILDFNNDNIYNGFPIDSIEYDGYNAGLASKGVTR